jgi:hypothetical protein
VDEERLERHDVTDEEWARLEPLLPVSTGWGCPVEGPPEGDQRDLPPDADRHGMAGCDEAEGEDWTVSADSTVVRAHQHAAEALGRSRGGLSTKLHLVADWRCRPLVRLTSPGQHADCLVAGVPGYGTSDRVPE